MFVLAAAMVTGLWGQTSSATIVPKSNSPLSRFGLGDPINNYFAAQGGMAGLSAAYQNPFQLNLLNPASLTQMQATAFEVGLYARYANLNDQQRSDQIWSGNINYLALGFPLINPINRSLDRRSNDFGAGMAFSLTPYTLVGYNLELKNNDDDVGATSNILKGTGGTYRVQWSNAVRFRDLSVGVNLGYLFGKITNSRFVGFDSSLTALSTEFLEEYSLGGVTWNAGAQYTISLKGQSADAALPSGNRIIIGVHGTGGSDFDTKSSQLFRRYRGLANRPVIDTLESITDIEGSGRLPAEWTAGIAFEDVNRLYIAAEYGRSMWSNYRNDAQQDRLENTQHLAAGLEYIPNVNSYNSYWKRVRYRLGVKYDTDPRMINNEQARRMALTLGAGLPIIMPRQQVSYINTAFEIGKFGVPDVIDETFVQFTLGFTLNDNSWFFKRKFN